MRIAIPLFFLIAFASANAVLVTPAFPAIAQDFSISEAAVEGLMTLFLVGYTVGQLLYGPLSNRFGRKPVIYGGIIVQIISQIVCLISAWTGMYGFLWSGRLWMALGSGVGLKMTFTILNELLEPLKARKLTPLLLLAFAITPALAVAVSGALVSRFGWTSCFYAGAVYGFGLLLLMQMVPETCLHPNPDALRMKPLLRGLAKQFGNGRLVISGLLMGSAGAFIYLFASFSPFISINQAGIAVETFGVYSLVPSVGLLVGSLLSAYTASILMPRKAIALGIAVVFAASGIMAIVHLFRDVPVLWGLFVPMIFINGGLSFIFSNATGYALPEVEDKANASAVMNFINMGVVTLIVWTSGMHTPTTGFLVLLFVLLSATMSGLLILLGNGKKQLGVTASPSP